LVDRRSNGSIADEGQAEAMSFESEEDRHLYGSGFFEGQVAGARSSAAAIVPMIMRIARPRSVVDVGCGVGAWLAAFVDAGVSDVVGIDGGYVDPGQLEIAEQQFVAANLAADLRLQRRFDLVVSLEVAEHLPEARAESFVADLVRLGPAILFGAAIPGQGGEHHVNERWPGYWFSRFKDHGYEPIDCIRAPVWNDDRVEFWYAQNTFLMLSRDVEEGTLERARASASVRAPVPAVHPKLLELSSRRVYSASELTMMLAGRLREGARRRWLRMISSQSWL
jgi:SAM-dependent methyltransferase